MGREELHYPAPLPKAGTGGKIKETSDEPKVLLTKVEGRCTPYGFVLAGKLVLLAALFSIASWNRWVLTVPAAAGDQRAIRHMRRGIVAEIVIALAILGLVSMLRFTPPLRALADATPAAAVVELAGTDISATLEIAPARIGPALATVALRAPDGTPLSAKAVKIVLEQPGSNLATITRPTAMTPEGDWTTDRLIIPASGSWLVELEVRISDFKLVEVRASWLSHPHRNHTGPDRTEGNSSGA